MAYGYWICTEHPEHRLYTTGDVIRETMRDAIKEMTRERLKKYVNKKYNSNEAYDILLARAYGIQENMKEFEELYLDIVEMVSEDIAVYGEDYRLFGLHYVWHYEDSSYAKKSKKKSLKSIFALFGKNRKKV